MADLLNLTDKTFDNHITSTEGLVVVDFWAPWCGPCRVIGPVIERLASEYDGRVQFAKLNVDHNQDASRRHGVKSIPTLLFFKGGEVADRTVGALPEKIIRQKIDQLLNTPAAAHVA